MKRQQSVEMIQEFYKMQQSQFFLNTTFVETLPELSRKYIDVAIASAQPPTPARRQEQCLLDEEP